MSALPAILTLRWSLRDGMLPETCDGAVRVVQLADERGPYFAATGEVFPWRGTSRVSPEMAARDWLRQTARGIGAEVMLTLPDGTHAHDAPFIRDPAPTAEVTVAEALARQRAAADAAVTEHALRMMGGEQEPSPAWRNTPGVVERIEADRPFALVRAHAATLDGPLGDDLRALLAAWDAEHPGAVGERYAASVGGSVWAVAEERGDDLVLRGERGEVWTVSRDFLAAEVRAGRMRRLADADAVPSAAPARVGDVLLRGVERSTAATGMR